MRHYALLAGKRSPRRDNAATGNRGEVGKTKQQARTNPSAQRRRLPAFARQVEQLRMQGMRPAGDDIVVRLDIWPPKERPSCVRIPQVVVSSDTEPRALNFAFVRDLDVLVAHWRSKSEPQRLRELLREILATNPRRLIVLDVERERHWWIKSVELGVEVQL